MKLSRITQLINAEHAALMEIKRHAQKLESDLTNLIAGTHDAEIANARKSLNRALLKHTKIRIDLASETSF